MTPAPGERDVELPPPLPGDAIYAELHEDAAIPELAPPVRVDRWAHRRVEPRGLALMWTLYLLGVTVMCFWTPATAAGLDPLAGRYSSRLLLIAVAVGYCVLWPMVRLCQAFPAEGGVRAVGKDLMVMIVPTQAVIWPLTFLALWPLSVASALAASSLAWTLVVGALLAIGLGGPRRERLIGSWRRLAWIGIILAVAARPTGWYDNTSEGGRVWMVLSGVSAPLTLTAAPASGLSWVSPPQWGMIGVTFALAVGLWLVAVGSGSGRHDEPV